MFCVHHTVPCSDRTRYYWDQVLLTQTKSVGLQYYNVYSTTLCAVWPIKYVRALFGPCSALPAVLGPGASDSLGARPHEGHSGSPRVREPGVRQGSPPEAVPGVGGEPGGRGACGRSGEAARGCDARVEGHRAPPQVGAPGVRQGSCPAASWLPPLASALLVEGCRARAQVGTPGVRPDAGPAASCLSCSRLSCLSCSRLVPGLCL